MADESDIADVKDVLPDDPLWDDDRIGQKLDAEGATVFTVVQNYWESLSAKYHAMIDVSESGSSRSLSRMYDNAVRQAEYWKTRADAEAAELEDEEEGRISFHVLKRV